MIQKSGLLVFLECFMHCMFTGARHPSIINSKGSFALQFCCPLLCLCLSPIHAPTVCAGGRTIKSQAKDKYNRTKIAAQFEHLQKRMRKDGDGEEGTTRQKANHSYGIQVYSNRQTGASCESERFPRSEQQRYFAKVPILLDWCFS